MKDGDPEAFIIDIKKVVQALNEEREVGWCTMCGSEQEADVCDVGNECIECGKKSVLGAFVLYLLSTGELE